MSSLMFGKLPVLAEETIDGATEIVEETAEGSGFNFSILWEKLVALATDVGGRLIGAILLLIIGGIVIRLVMKGLRKSRAFNRSDATVAHFLLNFIKIGLDVLLVVSVIAILGVPMSSVVAVIASAGVAIGLALQGALSNLAGGIMILIFKPFKIGNYVSVTGYEGTVRDIGIFYTVLTTVDNREVTIPNGTIMNNSIVNVSAYETRRVDIDFSVAYGTDVDRVEAMILEEAAKHELVLKDPAAFCRLTAHGDSSLTITLRAWCNNGDYWQVMFDLRKAVHARFAAESVEIPFPQVDVHMKQ